MTDDEGPPSAERPDPFEAVLECIRLLQQSVFLLGQRIDVLNERVDRWTATFRN